MKIKLLVTLFAVGLLSTFSINAQTVKIGYTNIDFILSSIPESKEVQTKLSTEKAQYDKLIQEKIGGYQKDFEDFQKLMQAGDLSPVIRADKEKSLQNKENEIREFQQNSETALQTKYQQLLSPVMDKIQEAIDAVAKANGYTYVLNSDAGAGTTPIVLVAPESDNITNLVLKQMGVEPPVEK